MIKVPPNRTAIQDQNGNITPSWQEFTSSAYTSLLAYESHGTTAQRPTTNLYPGRTYFDTSLGANGKPIWVSKTGSSWIDATGAAA